MTYPRALAIIESVWSPSENKEWNNFSTRLETHFNRFETAGKPISKAVYDPIVSVKKQDGKMMCTLSNDLADVAIYYTIDGTFPAHYSTKYTQPFEIPKGDITFRAVSYRKGKPIGRTLTISKEMLEKRIGK
jgi:hexosaminidase